jgi:tRNA dimethylallyltransferase
MAQKFHLLVILGPTASGKTQVGVRVARVLNGEIISADSRQVYRGMDLGTGKDLKDYGEVPYHLIDIVNPGYEFSVFEFQRRFISAFHNIRNRGNLPLLVGGTGLYLEAVLKGYQLAEVPKNPELRRELEPLSLQDLADRLKAIHPALHNTTDLRHRERLIRAIEIAQFRGDPSGLACLPDLSPIIFGIRWPKEVLDQRISARLRERIKLGMLEEIKRLHKSGVSWDLLDYYGLEYRYGAMYLRGRLTKNDFFQKLNSAIRQFAKRQETWFRRMERQGTRIHWVDGGRDPAGTILAMLENGPSLAAF